MGDGPEHDLAHLGAIAATVGMSDRVRDLADRTQAMLDDGVWPDRAAAVRPLQPRLFRGPRRRPRRAPAASCAWPCPDRTSCSDLAPNDDDLIALRDEIPALAVGT